MTRKLGVAAVALAVSITTVAAEEGGFELVLTSNIAMASREVGKAESGHDGAGSVAIKPGLGAARHKMVTFEFERAAAKPSAPQLAFAFDAEAMAGFEMGIGYFDYDEPNTLLAEMVDNPSADGKDSNALAAFGLLEMTPMQELGSMGAAWPSSVHAGFGGLGQLDDTASLGLLSRSSDLSNAACSTVVHSGCGKRLLVS
jgi:hypothetical protein